MTRPRRTFAALAAAGLALAGPAMASAATLRSPLAPLAVAVQRDRGARCPEPPRPVTSLGGISFYTDAQHSIVDQARRAENHRMQQPVVGFVDAIVDRSDAWRRSGDPRDARCVLAWLDRWATGGAFRTTSDVGGGYRRSWYLSGLAIAWLKVRDAPGIDPAAAQRIPRWMDEQAQQITRFYALPDRARDARNNHGDWAALAVAAAAVVADDATLFDWAQRRFDANLAEVGPTGALPLELARGRRALRYHLFALTPLAVMARFEQANRRTFDTAALDRLTAFVRRAIERPAIVAVASGARQDVPDGRSDPSEWVWAVIAGGSDGPTLLRSLAAARPLRDPRVGGDVLLAWSVARPLTTGS